MWWRKDDLRRMVESYGMPQLTFGGVGGVPPPIPPAGPQPLPPTPPATWAARVERVRWCLEHLTKGEKAYLYRLLHDGEGYKLDVCRRIEAEEEKQCRP